MKAKTVLLALGSILAIIADTIVIVEYLSNFGILNFLYPANWAEGEPNYTGNDYGVEWRMFAPPTYEAHVRPWADGPYCPKCKRDLETKKNRLGKSEWFCPLCEKTFPMPEGDIQRMVEKNFAAYLRRKREI
jgi:ribosomal protein L37AE/L43A